MGAKQDDAERDLWLKGLADAVRPVEQPTLRDRFAMAALTGILGARQGFLVDCGYENAAKWAWLCADEMLKARDAADVATKEEEPL